MKFRFFNCFEIFVNLKHVIYLIYENVITKTFIIIINIRFFVMNFDVVE